MILLIDVYKRQDEYMEHIKYKKCRAGQCKALANIEINPEKCKGCGICKETVLLMLLQASQDSHIK